MMQGRSAGVSRAAWRARAGAGLLLAMLLPTSRHAAEASMTAHMLVQYLGLLLAGGLLVDALATRRLQGLQRWNELGICGLAGSGLTLAVLMVPRVLDLALVDMRVESLKLAALVLSGAALRLSWQRAGVVVQAFFLGNVLMMTTVVGMLYQDSGTRVCNAYLLDDQHKLGLALVWLAAGVATLWLLRSGWQASLRGDPGRAQV
jgi:cytochrome c oxidase subunit IV